MTDVERIEDKIEGELKTARLYRDFFLKQKNKESANTFGGKVKLGKDILTWIKDNIKGGR